MKNRVARCLARAHETHSAPGHSSGPMLRILGALLLAALLAAPGPCPAGETWRITSLEWPPYSGSDLPDQGRSINILRKLLAQRDIELVVEFFPWARAKKQALRKGYTGFFPAWPEEVSDGFIASSPVDWSLIGVLTYEGSGLKWRSLPELFNSSIGLIKNYNYPEAVEEQARSKPKNTDPTNNEIALLRKLSRKRFKAAITDPRVMLYEAGKEGVRNIRILKMLGSLPLVLAFTDTPETRSGRMILEQLLRERNASPLGSPGIGEISPPARTSSTHP